MFLCMRNFKKEINSVNAKNCWLVGGFFLRQPPEKYSQVSCTDLHHYIYIYVNKT